MHNASRSAVSLESRRLHPISSSKQTSKYLKHLKLGQKPTIKHLTPQLATSNQRCPLNLAAFAFCLQVLAYYNAKTQSSPNIQTSDSLPRPNHQYINIKASTITLSCVQTPIRIRPGTIIHPSLLPVFITFHHTTSAYSCQSDPAMISRLTVTCSSRFLLPSIYSSRSC